MVFCKYDEIKTLIDIKSCGINFSEILNIGSYTKPTSVIKIKMLVNIKLI